MTQYRITIDIYNPEEKGVYQYHEVYRQEIEDLNVPAIVTFLNGFTAKILPQRLDVSKVGAGAYPPYNKAEHLQPSDDKGW